MQEINVVNLLSALQQAQQDTKKDGVVRIVKLQDYKKDELKKAFRG